MIARLVRIIADTGELKMLTGTWHRMPMDHVQEKVTDLSIVTSGTANMDRGIIHPGVVNIQGKDSTDGAGLAILIPTGA